MAYRVIFWRPRHGINVWLPPTEPLGESIRKEVLGGRPSDLLDSFQTQEMFQRLKSVFSDSRIDEGGYLHWSDEIDNGFVARFGEQFLEVCAFDAAEEDLEKIFSVAAEFTCEHHDWGN